VPKNTILITNAHLVRFGGSELVAVELAEHYAKCGWQVLLYSPIVGEPLRSTISPDVQVTSDEPLLTGWDIIWDHHGLLIHKIEKGSARIIVCNHMSSYVDLERPRYDANKPTRIFANSKETIHSMPTCYGARAELFQNPAPPEFQRVNHGGAYALSVSNHRPGLLSECLRDLSIPIRYVDYSEPERLSGKSFHDNLFFKARFVVCNGKTVQYALRAGVPVFLYDHFGGPGWLTEENFDTAAHFNFSGRGFHGKCVIDTLPLWPSASAIDMQRVNWRFKLEEWLYHMELI
jgi:hypothetical protein